MKKVFLVFLILNLANILISAPVIYQAENGVLSGTVVSASIAGYQGTGYVDEFDNDNDSCQITVNVVSTGMYNITVGYSTGTNGNKMNDLYANGDFQISVSFPASTGFTSIAAGMVPLNAGNNTISIKKNWGWFYLDWFGVEAAVLPVLSVPDTLVNTAASNAAKCLMSYLVNNYGNYIVSGQSNTSNAQWIYNNTGKYPALCGFDMMDYTDSRIARGGYSTDVNKAIAWYQAGGIVQFQWHWGAPMYLVDGAEGSGVEWYKGFYTNATTFDVEYAMNNTSSPEYLALVHDIDDIAAQLKILRDAGVPVLWRPLHEAQGGWFWWGAKGATACKQLYWLVFDRMVNYHGLNNLIWVWTTQDNTEAADWSPGNSYVDIAGADIYLNGLNYSPSTGMFYNIVNLFGGNKLVAMSENGTIPDPDLMVSQDAHWSYFMTWNGLESDGSKNPLPHLQTVYAHSYILTRDEIAEIYDCIPSATVTITPTWTPTRTSTDTRTPTITRTFTRTRTHTVSPTNTPVFSATITRTVTQTITGTPPTETVTGTITKTQTATPEVTATQVNTGEEFIIHTAFAYPCPLMTDDSLTISVSFNRLPSKVSVKIFTQSFRLIKKIALNHGDIDYLCLVPVTMQGLGNGLYYFGIEATDSISGKTKRRAGEFIILK